MAEKERIGKALAKSLKVGGVAVPKILAGQLAVTGTGTVAATGFAAITSVVATLGQDAAAAGLDVTATWSGLTVTLSVWKPTSTSNPTPIASTTATTVSYAVFGN